MSIYSIGEESSSCEIFDYDYKLAAKMGFNWTFENIHQIDNGRNSTTSCSNRDFDPSIKSIVTDVSFKVFTLSFNFLFLFFLLINYVDKST